MIRFEKNYRYESDDSVYDGVTDTDASSWFTAEFLNRRFSEYNTRFFGGQIPDVPVKIGRVSQKVLGKCVTRTNGSTIEDAKEFVLGLLMDNKITDDVDSVKGALEQYYSKHPQSVHVEEIQITDGKWTNRFFLEGTLLHEMCHAYQIEVLCKGNIVLYSKDCKLGKGSAGHGPKFFEAADLVNNSRDNVEGFKITQYGSSEEMSRKAYKKADGYLYIRCLANQMIEVSFVSAKSSRQTVVDMSGTSYMFGFRDGDVKAKFKVTRRTQFKLTNKYVRDVEDAIVKGDLFLYAVNEYGVWDRFVLTDDDRTDISQFIGYHSVVDCSLFGVVANSGDLDDLVKGVASTGAKWLVKRISRVIERAGISEQYVRIYPESFETMFAITDEDSVSFYGRCLNQPEDDRLSFSALKRPFTERRYRRSYETNASGLSDKVDDALFSLFDFDNSDVSVDKNGDLVMEIEHHVI